MLLLEAAAPIVVVDFHEVGDSSMISELRHLADGDESGVKASFPVLDLFAL